MEKQTRVLDIDHFKSVISVDLTVFMGDQVFSYENIEKLGM
jgi:hypothetical protein